MLIEQIEYAAAEPIVISLASLASDATRLAGRESTAIDNSGRKYLDALVSGFVKTGAAPTDGKRIDVWVYASHDHLPTYQAPFDGVDSAEALGSSGQRNAQLVRLASIIIDDTQRTYYVRPTSVAALFGGWLPPYWGLFIAHDTGVALDSTGSNHEFKYTGVHRQTDEMFES